MKTLADIAQPALISGDETCAISGLTSNSLDVKPGFLFAALRGTRVDGAKFIPQAIENGAVALLLDEGVNGAEFGLPFIASPDPRHDLALAAAHFYDQQPECTVAVTGTNGKTSVASFVEQIWQMSGVSGASLGTVGIHAGDRHWPLSHTTPDPVEIHEKLAMLSVEGITHLAVEASSHGLEQRRLEGVQLQAAAFTNITQDHLDYHGTMDAYFTQKQRLFKELLPADGIVVVDADVPGADKIIEIAKSRGLQLITVGRMGETLRLAQLELAGYGQELMVAHAGGKAVRIHSNLIGDFQASNLLVAAGLVLASGASWSDIHPHLANLKGAKGRMEVVGRTSQANGEVPVIVDYAHTPDALENALKALKPISQGGRIHVVFGCGGDRDKGKRPLMGAIAEQHADIIFVTDDNPRSENPATIRAEILTAAPSAIEIADRQGAISKAVLGLAKGDILLVAGKGHEAGQTVGEQVLPFLDHDAVAKALQEAGAV